MLSTIHWENKNDKKQIYITRYKKLFKDLVSDYQMLEEFFPCSKEVLTPHTCLKKTGEIQLGYVCQFFTHFPQKISSDASTLQSFVTFGFLFLIKYFVLILISKTKYEKMTGHEIYLTSTIRRMRDRFSWGPQKINYVSPNPSPFISFTNICVLNCNLDVRKSTSNIWSFSQTRKSILKLPLFTHFFQAVFCLLPP